MTEAVSERTVIFPVTVMASVQYDVKTAKDIIKSRLLQYYKVMYNIPTSWKTVHTFNTLRGRQSTHDLFQKSLIHLVSQSDTINAVPLWTVTGSLIYVSIT